KTTREHSITESHNGKLEKDKGLIRDSWESLGKNKVPHGIVMFTRLFELDPALLTLFSYSTNCGDAPECLSSPEFLEHVTKVRPEVNCTTGEVKVQEPSFGQFLNTFSYAILCPCVFALHHY
ncbi:neuroglobin-like, partial [Carassius carassius]|uniref:neuroglobin-like n=1 Tax=Carassius carassius TaxID=217509 RepID=UPI002869084E